ncbi:MAG: ADP-ribosylglycohydrolase family protein, partial [Gemmatimonadota bacterium]|nr:ADP-ribosylglycohydrolase family protein [Gemmatimonadota bacterium]
DDLYMDLAFLAVFDSLGLDAPVEALALKFAHAGFRLWHANQAGRWNILHGIMPPASGHWKNNPHADDIDFQIEADFIGLMCPGMPGTALGFCDKVGHIMNYGDGVYGGLFVAAMYSHAFVEDNIVTVVLKALESLPRESQYARCISDVIKWWRIWPDDWKRTWFEVQRNWAEDVGCPSGALAPFNIDAKTNGAYIVIGLLYGDMDFGRTVDIATRCGQDSDCNPSNAAGILGTLMGFEKIPQYWVRGLEKIEDKKFDYCNYSLNQVYEVNYRLAAELVRLGGGSVEDGTWTIVRQEPKAPSELEVGFQGLAPVSRDFIGGGKWDHGHILKKGNPYRETFEGCAFVIHGNMMDNKGEAECQVRVDGRLIEEVTLSGNHHDRRTPLFWNYDLEQGTHEIEVKMLGGKGRPRLNTLLVYSRTGEK